MNRYDETRASTLETIQQRRRRKILLNVAIAVALACVVLGAYLALYPGAEPPVAPPSEPEQAATPPPIAAPLPPVASSPPAPAPTPAEAEPVAAEPAFSLPALDESDGAVRSLLSDITPREEFTSWLTTQDLVRRFVAAVDNIAEGRSPADHLGVLRPPDKFRVIVTDDSDAAGVPAADSFDAEGAILVDPKSYARYDAITEVFVSLDSRAVGRLYRQLEPLIEDAYTDLGYPDRRFDDALLDAFVELLRTPVVVGQVALAPRIISYEYVDPQLERLSAAQKQLLRTGPTNAPRIQKKLREIATELGVDQSALPKSRVHQVASRSTD